MDREWRGGRVRREGAGGAAGKEYGGGRRTWRDRQSGGTKASVWRRKKKSSKLKQRGVKGLRKELWKSAFDVDVF